MLREKKYFIEIFDINFYTYVDIYGIPNTIILKWQTYIRNTLI